MNQTLKVLLVEDNEADALLVLNELKRSGYVVESTRVDSSEAFLAELDRHDWNLVISDYSLPSFSGLDVIKQVRQYLDVDIPLILVSGAIGEDTAVEAMKAGANDYVMKDRLARLGPAVERELKEAEGKKERRKLEQKLRVAERLQLVGQLVMGVAHEVRNPLHCISTVLDAMSIEVSSTPDLQTYMTYIREQVGRLAALVKDLLDMGKPVDPARMNADYLPGIVSAAVALWKEASPSEMREVRIIQPEKKGNLEVHADGGRLQQVFINLLDNATQHSPAGSRIDIVLEEDANDILVRIKDFGSGVAEENMKQLFEPFFTTRQGGTGLGLCIVQRVIRDHGGDIDIRNNEAGPGCMVTIRLPRLNATPAGA